MSGPASLTRILASAKASDLADWLKEVTAEAVAQGRCQIIKFPGVTMTHKQNTTTEASLADIVLENIKAKAEAEETREPRESDDDGAPPANAA